MCNLVEKMSIALLLLSPTSSLAQLLSFHSDLRLPAPEANSILIADVNHDGKNDILVSGSDKLGVYLGNGTGQFTPAKGSPFGAGPNATDIAIGDLNGDGNLDVVVANHAVPKMTALLGDGTGAFSYAPGSPFQVESNPHPHGVAVADFNGDGKADIAIDSWGENKLLVMFGNGDGTFQPAGRKFDTGKAPYRRLRSADLNGDGHADLLTSDWEGRSVTLLLGNGEGAFSRAGGKDIPVPDSPFGVATGDFNGDAHLDIAVCHYSGHATDPSKNGLSLLWGDGNGNFRLEKGSPFPTGNYPATVTAGDINGDGITDVATVNSADNSVTIYLGGKDGITQAGGSPVSVGHQPESAAIGDLNGDGRADIAVANTGDNDVLVLLNTSEPH